MEEITVPVTFKCLRDPSKKSGILHMHIEDCWGEVKDDGKVVGRVGAAIGAAIDVEINGALWSIPGLDLWRAVSDALENKSGK